MPEKKKNKRINNTKTLEKQLSSAIRKRVKFSSNPQNQKRIHPKQKLQQQRNTNRSPVTLAAKALHNVAIKLYKRNPKLKHRNLLPAKSQTTPKPKLKPTTTESAPHIQAQLQLLQRLHHR